MAIRTWTPADGFTRKPVKPTVTEKPKPPVQPKPKRRKPSERQRAYWLKRNRLSLQEYTVADQYLVKQIQTQTPMVFVGYGRVIACTVKKLWRYDLDLSIKERKRNFHKLDFAVYYKSVDASAVEKLLAFDADSVSGKPSRKLSEREAVDMGALRTGASVTLTLRTGHTLTGEVRWITAYDIGLTLDNGAKVHCFKHAIVFCQSRC